MSTEGKDNIMHHDESVAPKLQRLVGSEAYKYQRRKMLNMLDIPTVTTAMLDVGCGEGSFCRDLREQLPSGSLIIGLDASPFVLDIARQQETSPSEPIGYVLGNAQSLPFPPGSFDIVACAGTLKYLKTEDQEREAVRDQLNVLRSGGQLLVVDSDDITITYEGIDPDLSQKIVNAYAVLQGDPVVGNRIESLCRSIGLQNIRKELILLQETEFIPVNAGYVMAQNMRDVLKKLALDRPDQSLIQLEEIDEFYDQVIESANNGRYKWTYIKQAVVGRKETDY